ncbi:hypothetical protein OKA06_19595 [Novosphingobium sp. MW5]|nr:hypothetical protein [Novosphingobium sp. MW5]
MAGIDPDRTLDGFAHEYRRRRVPVVPGQLFQLFESEAIEPGTPVQRRPDLIYAIKVDGDEVALSVYGAEIVFPAHVEEALREALLLLCLRRRRSESRSGRGGAGGDDAPSGARRCFRHRRLRRGHGRPDECLADTDAALYAAAGCLAARTDPARPRACLAVGVDAGHSGRPGGWGRCCI